jgi:hypothetical protein
MRVAALYDIHANLPALEAVLDEIVRERVDLVVVGGDVLPGPMPRETLARLLDVGGEERIPPRKPGVRVPLDDQPASVGVRVTQDAIGIERAPHSRPFCWRLPGRGVGR